MTKNLKMNVVRMKKMYKSLAWFSLVTNKSIEDVLNAFKQKGLTGRNTVKGLMYKTNEGLEAIYDKPDLSFIDVKKEQAIVDLKLKKMKEEKMLGELAPIKVLEWSLGEMCKQIGAILETIPAKIKINNPDIRVNDLELIKKEIAKARNLASECRLDLD